MGAQNSKEQINEDLHKVGEEEINNIIDDKNDQSQLKEEPKIKISNKFIYKPKNPDPKKDYNILKSLKKGAYTDTFLVENKLSKIRCIMKSSTKLKTFSQKDEDILNNELKILSILDHPNIINVHAFYSSKDSYSYITEFCQEGDLYELLMNKGVCDENKTAYIMYQIFSAVNYCHKNKIINRELTLENILISEIKNNLPNVKIGYFCNSILAQKNAIQIKSTPHSFYSPPEINRFGDQYTDKSDIWLCGIIMYFLFAGRPPFIGKDESEKKANIRNEDYDISIPPFDKVSLEYKKLLKQLLKANPAQRPSAEEILNDQWFKKFGSKSLYFNINRESTIEKLLNNIKNYQNVSIFQKYAISYLIHNFPQITDVKNAAKLFYMIDSNNDGKIAKDELFKGLNDILQNKITDKDFDIIYQHIDLNNSGFIDYEEFVAAAVNKNLFMRDNILNMAFKFFDKDDSGEITFDEIEMMFKEAVNDGKTDVHKALENILKEIDINIDGKINFEEFSIFMKQLIK